MQNDRSAPIPLPTSADIPAALRARYAQPPMPAREVDVDALERRLLARDHELFCEIRGTRAYLEALVGEVVERLERIHPLSCELGAAFAKQVDADDLAADPIREEIERRVGMSRLWDLADRLERALPDNCDCRKHGCAGLAGVPTGRAD